MVRRLTMIGILAAALGAVAGTWAESTTERWKFEDHGVDEMTDEHKAGVWMPYLNVWHEGQSFETPKDTMALLSSFLLGMNGECVSGKKGIWWTIHASWFARKPKPGLEGVLVRFDDGKAEYVTIRAYRNGDNFFRDTLDDPEGKPGWLTQGMRSASEAKMRLDIVGVGRYTVDIPLTGSSEAIEACMRVAAGS